MEARIRKDRVSYVRTETEILFFGKFEYIVKHEKGLNPKSLVYGMGNEDHSFGVIYSIDQPKEWKRANEICDKLRDCPPSGTGLDIIRND